MALFGAVVLVAPPSHAKDEPVSKADDSKKDGPSAAERETARGAMDQGDKLFEAGDYEGALASYEAADKIMGVTSTGYAVGKTLEKLGRLVKARDKLLEVTRIAPVKGESPILTRARENARTLQDDVAGRIPAVTFEIKGVEPGSKVTLVIGDYTVPEVAVSLPQRIDPGEHNVTASCPGYEDVVLTVIVAERDEKTITLTFGPKVGPVIVDPPGEISPLVFVGFGAAGAGLILGGVTGGLAISMANGIRDRCDGNICQVDDAAKADTARDLAHVSTAGFVFAGVGAGVGVVGLLLSDFGGSSDDNADPAETPPQGVTVQPIIGLGHVGLKGTF